MKFSRKSKVLGAFLGTIVEYYDYSLYAFSAGTIALKFFPASDPITNLANVFGIYALAYLSKPLGSLIFGWLGDIYGRKIALSITILGITIPTAIIGILPEYSAIGIWSPIILLICRFLQSIFVSGEYDGAAIYVIEHLGARMQYTASAITRFMGVLGLLLGIGSANLFNSHIFPEWGWRVPFLLSLPLSLITIYYRSKLDETPDFKRSKFSNNQNLYQLLIQKWRIILLIIFLAGGFGVTYQVSILFMKQYLPIVLPQIKQIISSISILLVLCFGLSMPLAGLAADRFGNLIVIQISLIGTILFCLAIIVAIKLTIVNLVIISCLLLAASVAPFNALAHGLIIKGFKPNERYRGVSFGHNIGSMLMSGSANFICAKMMEKYNLMLFPIFYICFFAVVSYLIIVIFEKQLATK